MTARPIRISTADGHLVGSDRAVPAMLVNPEARDCDIAAGAASLISAVRDVLTNIACRDEAEDAGLAQALAGSLELAGELLFELIDRIEPKASAE